MTWISCFSFSGRTFHVEWRYFRLLDHFLLEYLTTCGGGCETFNAQMIIAGVTVVSIVDTWPVSSDEIFQRLHNHLLIESCIVVVIINSNVLVASTREKNVSKNFIEPAPSSIKTSKAKSWCFSSSLRLSHGSIAFTAIAPYINLHSTARCSSRYAFLVFPFSRAISSTNSSRGSRWDKLHIFLSFFPSRVLFLVCSREEQHRRKESTQHNWISVGNNHKNECVWFHIPFCDCMLHSRRRRRCRFCAILSLSISLAYVAADAASTHSPLFLINADAVHVCFLLF